MFPFSEGVREFQAMVAAGLTPARALRAGTSVAAELLQRDDLGVIAPGKQADIVAMWGDPLDEIACTAKVDFVMKGVGSTGMGPSTYSSEEHSLRRI
jgi:imidazolonepropionase-like amidohydrolase